MGGKMSIPRLRQPKNATLLNRTDPLDGWPQSATAKALLSRGARLCLVFRDKGKAEPQRQDSNVARGTQPTSSPAMRGFQSTGWQAQQTGPQGIFRQTFEPQCGHRPGGPSLDVNCPSSSGLRFGRNRRIKGRTCGICPAPSTREFWHGPSEFWHGIGGRAGRHKRFTVDLPIPSASPICLRLMPWPRSSKTSATLTLQRGRPRLRF